MVTRKRPYSAASVAAIGIQSHFRVRRSAAGTNRTTIASAATKSSGCAHSGPASQTAVAKPTRASPQRRTSEIFESASPIVLGMVASRLSETIFKTVEASRPS